MPVLAMEQHSKCHSVWHDIFLHPLSPHLTPSFLNFRLPECLGETAAWTVLMGAGADVLSRQLSITSTVWA